jgi:hypothetical protein
MGVLELINLLVFKLFLPHALFICTVLRAPPPPLPVTASQGLVRRPIRGQESSGRLYSEHRSCRERLGGSLSGNITCKCDLPGPNTVNQRIIYHQFKRTGKSHATWETINYRYFEAGPTSMDPLSCSVCHSFLIQC